jgi:hypothetical protein
MELIGSYISELSTALRGPRKVKLDLLAESRDSLADAAEAYERDGVPPPEAERRAVEEFGDLSELVPAYQEELAMAQGRRTALVVLVALALQHTLAEVVWQQLAGRAPGPPPTATPWWRGRWTCSAPPGSSPRLRRPSPAGPEPAGSACGPGSCG